MEDRPGLFDESPVLSDTQSDELVAYRPVSTLAVAGVVLAVLSTLALVTPWLVWLPALAAVACFVAARSVDGNQDAKTGAGLARAGLVLSLLLGAAVFGRAQYRQIAHSGAARPVAEQFLGHLVAGDAFAAFELTLPLADRRPSADVAKTYYQTNEDAAKRLADFGESPGAARLLGSGELPALGSALPAAVDQAGRVTIAWEFDAPATEPTRPQRMTLRLQRPAKSSPDSPASWRVGDLLVRGFSG